MKFAIVVLFMLAVGAIYGFHLNRDRIEYLETAVGISCEYGCESKVPHRHYDFVPTVTDTVIYHPRRWYPSNDSAEHRRP